MGSFYGQLARGLNDARPIPHQAQVPCIKYVIQVMCSGVIPLLSLALTNDLSLSSNDSQHFMVLSYSSIALSLSDVL